MPGVKKVPRQADHAGSDNTTRSLRDNSLAVEAQIGLPIRVAYLWDVAEGTPVPKEITVDHQRRDPPIPELPFPRHHD